MKRTISLILAALMLASAVSCDKKLPAETTLSETEAPVPEAPKTAEHTLTNGTVTLSLKAENNKLYITNAATTASGVNMLAEMSEYPLPLSYGTEPKTKSKNALPLNWTFVSAEEFENKDVNGVPTSGVIYHFEDNEHHLKLRVYCQYRPGIDGPFEFYSEVDNLNETEFRIIPEAIASFTLVVPDPETTEIFRVKREGWLAEGFPAAGSNTVHPGTGVYTSKLTATEHFAYGGSTSGAAVSPTMGREEWFLANYIDRNGKDGLFFALEWTHGYFEFTKTESTTVRADISINPLSANATPFQTEIPAGDTLLLPPVYLMPYDGSIDNGSNLFKHWFFECKAPSKLRDDPSEPYTQIDWQLSPEAAVEANIDSLKLDYGWWSGIPFGKETAFEGAWTLLAEGKDAPGRTVESLLETGKLCKELGLNFTTYILLHSNRDLDGKNTTEYGELNIKDHPQWFSHETHRDTNLVDLGNEEAVAYLQTTLSTLFNTYGIGTWRTDFQPIISLSDKENRHDARGTDVQYWATVGFAELIDYLYENVENFRFESCNSGGESKNLHTATQAIIFNVEDQANYLNLRAAFYDSSYILHPAQLQFPCNPDSFNPVLNTDQYRPAIAEPAVAEGDTYDFYDSMMDMGFRTTMMGVSMWGSWTNQPPVDYYKEYATLYRDKVRPLVREAELYHILPRPDGINWDGMMYADPDTTNNIKGLVFLFKPSLEADDTCHVVFDGLFENTVYKLSFEDHPEQNRTATGAELMTNGIDVEIKYVGSELIWITEAE